MRDEFSIASALLECDRNSKDQPVANSPSGITFGTPVRAEETLQALAMAWL
jgi:hypothetical protein